MTKTNFVFSYAEQREFEAPLELSMEFPERSIDEMCEYFQRFLMSAGMIFEEGERIGVIKPQQKKTDDIVDFGGYAASYLDDTSYNFSNLRGGFGNDIINLS